MNIKPYKLKRPCPSCQKANSVQIKDNKLSCLNDSCDFHIHYQCPICDADITPAHYYTENDHRHFQCKKCHHKIAVRKIQNLIDNSLIVDHNISCEVCQGPTVHRPDVNVSHRCFFYPSCTGQTDLFSASKESFTFLDFETTGLEVGRNEIIEIGALKIDEEGYEDTLQLLIKPQSHIPSKITSITGITNEMVENSPPIKEGITQLKDFIGDSIIVAHNADFDIPWYITSCMKQEVEIGNNPIICTLKWARKNKEARCSLGVLTKKYGIGHNNAHRALADAAATKELFFIFENQKTSPRPERSLSDYFSSSETIINKYKKISQV